MKFLLLAGMLVPFCVFARGGTVENGGDTIYCAPSAFPRPMENRAPDEVITSWPLYSRDYVAARTAGAKAEDFVAPPAWLDSQIRIARILASVSDQLEISFQDFGESLAEIGPMSRLNDGIRIRSWEKVERKTYILEEKEIPEDCYLLVPKKIHGATFNFYIKGFERSILRTENGPFVNYAFNPVALRKLQENSALQLSFIFVHEWLWDHTRNAKVNRRVNAFLHSRSADAMTGKEIARRLRRLGLKF